MGDPAGSGRQAQAGARQPARPDIIGGEEHPAHEHDDRHRHANSGTPLSALSTWPANECAVRVAAMTPNTIVNATRAATFCAAAGSSSASVGCFGSTWTSTWAPTG